MSSLKIAMIAAFAFASSGIAFASEAPKAEEHKGHEMKEMHQGHDKKDTHQGHDMKDMHQGHEKKEEKKEEKMK